LNKRQSQLEAAHSMLLRHHEMTQVNYIIVKLWTDLNT
jgi:hypothetical protein